EKCRGQKRPNRESPWQLSGFQWRSIRGHSALTSLALTPYARQGELPNRQSARVRRPCLISLHATPELSYKWLAIRQLLSLYACAGAATKMRYLNCCSAFGATTICHT